MAATSSRHSAAADSEPLLSGALGRPAQRLPEGARLARLTTRSQAVAREQGSPVPLLPSDLYCCPLSDAGN